ncbi:MAG: hypothetical protein K1X74_01605 [Pirellulales bacterium]|nr:hypothetical protein [Pirellulales bacterium]
MSSAPANAITPPPRAVWRFTVRGLLLATVLAALAFAALRYANAWWACAWGTIHFACVVLALSTAAGAGGRSRAFAIGFILGAFWSSVMNDSMAASAIELACQPVLQMMGYDISEVTDPPFGSTAFWSLTPAQYAASVYQSIASLLVCFIAGLLAAWFHDRYHAARSAEASAAA